MVFTHYDLVLAVCSFFVACFLCYLSASLAERVVFRRHKYTQNKIQILLSGFILSLAVWITYFFIILMIDIPAEYHFDYAITLVSFLITFIASTFSVWATTQFTLTPLRLILGSILMGLGISAMHYICTMGLLIEHYAVVYKPITMSYATLIAILGSASAYALMVKSKKALVSYRKSKLLFSIIMSISIIGMHYVGMLSISFYEDLDYKYKFLLKTNYNLILFSVILISSVIFCISGVIAFLEQRLDERNRQLQKANHDLANQAIHDNLTKLPNRLYLREYAQVLFSDPNNISQSAFLHIDVDRFKVINEVFGHHIGDRLLIQLANRMYKNLNEKEHIFRLSGDEFILLIEQTNLKEATEKAEFLQKLIHESFLIEGHEINISASIGIALLHEHGKNLPELLKSADSAMLKAKHQGRNSYNVFNYSDELLPTHNKPELMSDLYKAVDENQFILFYQPKFKVKTNQVCGVEALIRWKHSTHGLLTPNMFIKGAETSGVIIQLGYLVLEEAFKQIQTWENNHINVFPVAVNLSAVQFEHKELFLILEQLFDKYKINPSHLTIEITESIAMQNVEMSILRFERLHQMGIKLAIDDFGTGYSSLLYLKDLAIDELKIDRAFIQDIEKNNKSEILLESIINLAIQLGLTVTVEGVETSVQAEKLTALGCQQLQGFLLGKPMPADQLEQWVDKNCLK